jgi:hypothetical protein
VATIEIEEDCSGCDCESGTHTYLLINDSLYSSWVVTSNGYYNESISWELLKTEEELAEAKRVYQEEIKRKEENKKNTSRKRKSR